LVRKEISGKRFKGDVRGSYSKRAEEAAKINREVGVGWEREAIKG